MSEQLASEVLTALKKVAPEIDPAKVDRRVLLVEQLDLDSMDVQRFLTAVGERYHVDIPEADVPALGTIEQIVTYLESHGAR